MQRNSTTELTDLDLEQVATGKDSGGLDLAGIADSISSAVGSGSGGSGGGRRSGNSSGRRGSSRSGKSRGRR